MADKLIICVSQHHAWFDQGPADYEDNNLYIRQSITDQLGAVNGE